MDPSLSGLASSVPASVRHVCETLQTAGHAAYTVGGAVRDALLGRDPGDWDITTSAHPDDVVSLFRKTIPTGIEHGTVTVIVGRGSDRMAIEVTTFRGEGAYSDSRRPDSVIFNVPLREDLARRDFVVNAMAFDPISGGLEDPFGGVSDINAKIVRAVGDPASRFREDGLRVLRAVRFVSVLDFDLDPATEAALELANDALSRVAAERVRVELLKLLGGPGAKRGLTIANRRGVLSAAVPILAEIDWQEALSRAMKLPPDPLLRLAGLLFVTAIEHTDRAMRALTLSSKERARVVTTCRIGQSVSSATDAELRAILGSASRTLAPDVATLWRADGRENLATRAEEVLQSGDALVASELAIGGKDVMKILGIGPSRTIGEHLEAALALVHRDPSANTREQLSAFLRERSTS